MTGALKTASDYAGALSALLPRGRVWPKDQGAVQQTVIGALAQTPERLDSAAQGVVVDAFPGSSLNLLAEWEASTGLVSQDEGLSTAQRQAAITAALTALGGQSEAYMIAYAAALGATIAITIYAPTRCGIAGCGDPCGGLDWAFAWAVHISANTGQLSGAQLQAVLQSVAPAETTVLLD